MPPKSRSSRRPAITGKIIKEKASNRRLERSQRAGRTKAKQATRADLIKSMRRQAESELMGIDCGRATTGVIRKNIGKIQSKMQQIEEDPSDENIFDAACELCCKKDDTCKGECKKKLKRKFRTTKELIKIEEEKGKKVYESVFSDEDDLQLKF